MGTELTWPNFFVGLNQASMVGENARLGRARALIEARYAEAIDLDAMAAAAALSRYHFARRFRAVYGITPHAYLTERRLGVARTLLETTERTVTDICFDVGFHSVGSFSTLFRRHVGRSPVSYRRRLVQSAGIARCEVPACFVWKYSNIGEASHAR